MNFLRTPLSAAVCLLPATGVSMQGQQAPALVDDTVALAAFASICAGAGAYAADGGTAMTDAAIALLQ